jgi:hypothetical protein
MQADMDVQHPADWVTGEACSTSLRHACAQVVDLIQRWVQNLLNTWWCASAAEQISTLHLLPHSNSIQLKSNIPSRNKAEFDARKRSAIQSTQVVGRAKVAVSPHGTQPVLYLTSRVELFTGRKRVNYILLELYEREN